MQHALQETPSHPGALADILNGKIKALRAMLAVEDPRFDAFIHAALSAPGLRDYKYFPPLCHTLWTAAALEAGVQATRIYLALTILLGMQQTLAQPRLEALPPRVRQGQLAHLQWLAATLTGTEEWLDLNDDTYQKEFGLATLRLYACGAQLVDYRCGIPRSIAFKSGVSHALSQATYFARIGGFKPFFQIHTHVHRLAHFTEEGWNECYRCCAELYEVHPDVLGMYGGSWFYDPQLRDISPRLRYLQDVPLAGGARLFRSGPSEACNQDALSTSPTRKELFNQGLYTPCAYVLVWDRTAQRQWAASAS